MISFNEFQQIRTIEDLVGDDLQLLERGWGQAAMGMAKKYGPGLAKQAVQYGGNRLANRAKQDGGSNMVNQIATQAVNAGIADQLIATIQQMKMQVQQPQIA